ncbi:TetR/AcrR family transcriptional regulator [Arthrobacter sp. NPDC058097]|uniref:TetR/AcrR family transcriptional regulator n=1 Tax=Arthrobacter sp. NPDC058097 TaxID=3346340 RepID=UPI0036D79775
MSTTGRSERSIRLQNPENRERILWAGLKEFAAVGYEGANISAIAKQSGLNKQLIYHYFGSKRGLYDAVLETMLKRTLSAPDAGIEEILEATPEFEYAQEWVRMLGWEGLQYGGGDIPFARERGEGFSVLQRDIERLQKDGRLDVRIDPRYATLLVSLALIAPQILPQLSLVLTGEDGSSPEFRRQMVRLLELLLGLDPKAR